MNRVTRACRGARPFCLLAGLIVGLAAPSAAQSTASYHVVDNVEQDWVNLDEPPVRSMALSADGTRLWAVNNHGNTLVEFSLLTNTRVNTWSTPWLPVAVATVEPTAGNPDGSLLVVCRGSYVLVRMNRQTGRVTDVLQLTKPTPGPELYGEPLDLLVDAATQRAYVSCSGADVVLEVNLNGALSILREFQIPGKRPQHMCFAENGDVFVAPLFSGNNSAIHKPPSVAQDDAGPGGVLNLSDPAVCDVDPATGIRGLPDNDLFRLELATGLVKPAARGTGTLLFAMGLNPVPSGDGARRFWQLNTEANNKDKDKQSEELISGEVVFNRLSIVKLGASGTVAAPESIVELDDTNGATGIQYDPTRTVGQPDGLCFKPNGEAFVVGVLTDNVTRLNAGGAFQEEWNLPDGSIPRNALWSASSSSVLVYCWGTNKVEIYSGNPMSHVATLDLGFDPTPQIVKEGRTIFYDGSNSKHNNQSCHSCHPNGTADMVVWNISNMDADGKGPMVTQNLRSIDRLGPMHWRGEQQRGLIDFDPAFPNLLGAPSTLSRLPGGLFPKFEAFVLSLRSPANPFQNKNRVIDDAIQPPLKPGSTTAALATVGQANFLSNSSDSCERCHMFPTGSSNEIQIGSPNNPNPRRQRFEVGHFIELYRKEQDADRTAAGIQLATVKFNQANPLALPATAEYALLGAGLLHAGTFDSLHGFVNAVFTDQDLAGGTFFGDEHSHLVSFVHQWDQGMGPACHRAYLLNASTQAAVAPELTSYLRTQAQARNCDVAVFGFSTIGGVQKPMRWNYNRASDRFEPEDPGAGNQRWVFFVDQAQQSLGSNVFLGLPVGTGEKFAIDFDGDDLVNGLEAAGGLFNPDVDGDGDPDGHEFKNPSGDATPPQVVAKNVQWFTTEVGTITLQTNEPTTASVQYTETTSGITKTVTDGRVTKWHRLVLPDLLPSVPVGLIAPAVNRTYTGTVTVTDLGNQQTALVTLPDNKFATFYSSLGAPPSLPLGSRNVLAAELQPTNLQWVGTPVKNVGAGTIQATAKLTVGVENSGPPLIAPSFNSLAIFRVLKNGKVTTFTTSGGTPSMFSIYFAPPGSPTNCDPGGVTVLYSLVPDVVFPGKLPGTFLIPPTLLDANGETTVQFTVGGLAVGDEVTLNLEILSHPLCNAYVPSAPVIPGFAFNRWTMPDTDKSFRSISTKL